MNQWTRRVFFFVNDNNTRVSSTLAFVPRPRACRRIQYYIRYGENNLKLKSTIESIVVFCRNKFTLPSTFFVGFFSQRSFFQCCKHVLHDKFSLGPLPERTQNNFFSQSEQMHFLILKAYRSFQTLSIIFNC